MRSKEDLFSTLPFIDFEVGIARTAAIQIGLPCGIYGSVFPLIFFAGLEHRRNNGERVGNRFNSVVWIADPKGR